MNSARSLLSCSGSFVLLIKSSVARLLLTSSLLVYELEPPQSKEVWCAFARCPIDINMHALCRKSQTTYTHIQLIVNQYIGNLRSSVQKSLESFAY